MSENKPTLKEYLRQFFTEQETYSIMVMSSPEVLSSWIHDYVTDCFPEAREANELDDLCGKIEQNSQP